MVLKSLLKGLEDTWDNIKGFREAWDDDYLPVYTTSNSDKWTPNHNKQHRWIGNFNHGDAYFVIPKYPFRGEISAYHFLMAHEFWQFYKKVGKQSPTATFTVINANDRFSQFDQDADAFIRDICEKKGIPVHFNTELVEVKGKEQLLTLKFADGRTEERDFNNLYAIPRGLTQPTLAEAGLADANGFLDVNPTTLQTRKYENIWGLGDILNLPITKTYWSAFHQLHCLRWNLHKALKGVPLHAPYDGYTKAHFPLGMSKSTWFERTYKGTGRYHMMGTKSGFLAGRMYSQFAGYATKQQKVQLGKDHGPPFGHFAPFGRFYKGEPLPSEKAPKYVAAPQTH